MATFNFQFFVNVTNDPTGAYIGFVHGYVPGAHMKLGYVGTVDSDSIDTALDELYKRFNFNHPSDYNLSSMSVGDVVVINDVAYACEKVGWQYFQCMGRQPLMDGRPMGSFDPNNKNRAWTSRF